MMKGKILEKTIKEEQAFIAGRTGMFHHSLQLKGGREEGSMVPGERTSKSPIGTLSDIGRERGASRAQDESHPLKLTNKWEWAREEAGGEDRADGEAH